MPHKLNDALTFAVMSQLIYLHVVVPLKWKVRLRKFSTEETSTIVNFKC